MTSHLRYPLIPSAVLAIVLAFSTSLFAQTTPQGRSLVEAQAQLQASGLAESAPEIHGLFTDMGLYAILDVMAAEGTAGANDLEADMFPGRGGSAWRAVIADIYATDRMVDRFERAVPLEAMTEAVVAELQAFYDTDLGARVAAGELEARRAFLEPGVEESATDLARERAAEGDPRSDLLRRFIAGNDLIEHNVSGALNSNFAFYRGLSDGGAFSAEIPEELMLAEVWSQEAQIRTDMTDWLFGYQTLAYEDLSDAEMEAYLDLTMTEAGQVLNQVLFAAFAELFDAISYDLGLAAARFIVGEET